MAWFRKDKKPLKAEDRRDLPGDVFEKCNGCGEILYREKLAQNLQVCPTCGHHFRIDAEQYVALLMDEGSFEEIDAGLRSGDPLSFKDLKPYRERLRAFGAIAEERLDTERFHEFRETHLGHLDEVTLEFFESEEAKEAVRKKVEATFPVHEIEKFTEHSAKTAEEHEKFAIKLLIGVSLGAVIFAFVASWFLVQWTMTRPLGAVVTALEALIGAAFIDSGMALARKIVLEQLKPELEEIQASGFTVDSKSELQHLAQTQYHEIPRYTLISSEGPDHAKLFTVEVSVGDQEMGRGQGRNKKQAELNAARQALETLAATGS